MKKIIVSLLGLIVIASTMFPFFVHQTVGIDLNTVYVDINYTGNEPGFGEEKFNIIQEAIDVVTPGWTVHVFDGEYYEGITIWKSITLKGQNRDTTIIDSTLNESDTIEITTDDVTVMGFTIRNGGFVPEQSFGGIRINDADRCTLTNNILTNNDHFGIYAILSDENEISGNIIEATEEIGVKIYNSNINEITSNTISNNDIGVSILSSTQNTVINNIITHHDDSGVKFFLGSSTNYVYENSFEDNGVGVNGNDSMTMGNEIYHNNFVNNTLSAYDEGLNFWDDDYPSGGNYWDDYKGDDNNPYDGIGDTARPIEGDGRFDNYPLIFPFGSDPPLEISTPSSVSENESFIVNITSYTTPIQDARVNFNSGDFLTDEYGQVELLAPFVEENTIFPIDVSKENYQSASTAITVINITIPVIDSLLVIQAPSTILENQEIIVVVTANEEPISEVTVTFNEHQYSTNLEGIATFPAPEVNDDTPFSITASKEGFTNDVVQITIRNTVDTGEDGIIAGYVRNSTEFPVFEANVCAFRDSVNYCQMTNPDGYYTITLPPGIYSVTASKEGFISSTHQNIVVFEGITQELDIQLIEELSPGDDDPDDQLTSYMIENTIQRAVETGELLGKLIVDPGEDPQVISYEVDFEATIIGHTPEELTFQITGPDGPSGEILAIRLGEGTLRNMQELIFHYDGLRIEKIGFDALLNLELSDSTGPQWTSILTLDGDNKSILYLLVFIPEFSTHEISLTSAIAEVVAEISETITAYWYIIVSCILAVLIIIPIILIDKR